MDDDDTDDDMDDGIDADEIEETAAEKEAKRAAADKEQHDILVRAASDQIVQGETSTDKEPDSDEPDSDEPVTTKPAGDATRYDERYKNRGGRRSES